MGYANSLPYQQITVRTGVVHGGFLIENSNTHNYDIADFILPNFTAPLSKAYLSLIVQYIHDTSGANNSVIAGSYGIKDSGGTYRAAETFNTGAFYVVGNAYQMNHVWETSTQDLHTYITAGATQSARVEGIQALADDMILNNIFAQLDLYFAID